MANLPPLADDNWRREVRKFTKEQLVNLIESTYYQANMDKTTLINRYRNECLVREFNAKYPVGATVFWRAASLNRPYKPMVVERAAFITNEQALCFFEGKSTYCSIESKFITEFFETAKQLPLLNTPVNCYIDGEIDIAKLVQRNGKTEWYCWEAYFQPLYYFTHWQFSDKNNENF
jgi:hypothetical protein